MGQKGKRVETVASISGLQPSDRWRMLRAAPRDNPGAPSSAAVPTCIWMSFAASQRISSAVHEIGAALDEL